MRDCEYSFLGRIDYIEARDLQWDLAQRRALGEKKRPKIRVRSF